MGQNNKQFQNPLKNAKLNKRSAFVILASDTMSIALAITLAAIFAPFWWIALIVGIVGAAIWSVVLAFVIKFVKGQPKAKTHEEIDEEARRMVAQYLQEMKENENNANLAKENANNTAKGVEVGTQNDSDKA